MPKIHLNGPHVRDLSLPEGATYREAARAAGASDEVFAVRENGVLRGLYERARDGAQVSLVGWDDPEARELYRHSSAHIMASAVNELFPRVKYAIGPAIEDGFFYDFEVERPFSEEDLRAIEAKMQEIVDRDVPFEKTWVAKAEAIEQFRRRDDKYKVEILQGIADPEVSIYRHGDFVDLCTGPHLPSTGRLRAFKLLSIAGSYWRGDPQRDRLQRIYGTSWNSREELEAYLHRLEEAKKRDHRRIGKDLDLFSLHEDVGGGLVFWHPRGARVRTVIEDFWRRRHLESGYELVYTPHVGRSSLWETSGHLDFYKDAMYPPMKMDESEFYVKPMNCPFHIKIYRTALHSYRELPLRWAELGAVYRYELPGVLHGLLRVRGFTQDDAHLFVRPDQMDEEIDRVLAFCLDMYRAFGFRDFDLFLATRPAKAVGEPEQWEAASGALRKALEKSGLPYQVDEGGGALYGPQIDINIKDAIGRSWQCGTIQFDFNEPNRFDLEYIGEDGQAHRPYMIHRALLGSMERFFGILIEHYGGDFPLWLAPVQVRILSISKDNAAYARAAGEELVTRGVRAEVDERNEKIGAKIRDAELLKVPYMLVVGRRDQDGGTVSVRRRGQGDLGAMPRPAFLEKVLAEIESRQ
jgi:threonyl-tRNA synthetase